SSTQRVSTCPDSTLPRQPFPLSCRLATLLPCVASPLWPAQKGTRCVGAMSGRESRSGDRPRDGDLLGRLIELVAERGSRDVLRERKGSGERVGARIQKDPLLDDGRTDVRPIAVGQRDVI